MPRRVSLPGADELFGNPRAEPWPSTAEVSPPSIDARARQPSGRVRHDEKITIYVTADELLTLEHTRLAMRAQHGVTVDRGRIVREAIHLALQDVVEHGDESALVRRLREQ